jgi:subtilisin family serine protease
MTAAAQSILKALLVGLLLGVAGQVWAQGMPQASADRYSAFEKRNRPDLVERVRRDGEVAVVVGLHFDAESATAARAAPGSAARVAGIAAVQRALAAKLQRFNPQALRKFRHLPYMAMRLNESALDALLADAGVRSVEIDRHFVPTLIETPTMTHAVDAWNAGYTGGGQVVAIVDTGVDKLHPFLSGKVVEEACFSTPEYAFLGRSLCPGGAAAATGPGSGVPCVSSAPGCYHGTHVAGIAAGHRGLLGADAGGMAPDAGLIAIQVFQELCLLDCQLVATTSDIIAALDYVYGMRTTYSIASVNLSLAGGLFDYPCDDETPSLTDAVNLLRSAGIATVAGSGNDGSPTQLGQPACISTVVSVGSVEKDGSVSYFSNGSVGLSLLAPGGDVLSSLPGGAYDALSGTSMATPHVAGAWAVLKGADPSAGVGEVLGALQASGTPVTDPRTNLVTPMIQIAEATGALISTPPTVALTEPAPGTVFVAPADITLTANASDSDGTISRVEFYAGEVKIGEATTPPYTFTWYGIGPGVYTLTARALDNQFGVAVSTPVTVTVEEGAPWVNFAAQSNGGVATASSSYSAAYLADGVNDGDRKGLNWGSGGGWNDGTPYAYPDWLQVQFSGLQSINEINVFTVQDAYTAPAEPTASMTFTQNGITAFEVQYWDGSAWVTVPGGTVSGNNKVWRKFNFSTVSTDRIRVLIHAALAGYSRLVEVEAYGSSSGVPINQPPSVSISQPADGATFERPVDLTLNANASDSDGSISKVEYYAGSTKIGEAFAPPYALLWTDVPAGTYALTARAYDDQAASTVSAPVNIVVTEPGVTRINLALQSNGAVASASSSYGAGYPAAAVNDGDRKGLNWGSGGGWNDGTPNKYPDWVQVQFDGVQTIDEIDVFTLQDAYTSPAEPTESMTFGSYGVTAFEVQYWDGSAWVTVPGGTVSGNNKVWRKFSFPAVSTDRIRVLVHASLDRPGYSRVVEVEAYGSGGGAPGI